MNQLHVVFFGSTSDSVIVLNSVHEWSVKTKQINISAVVTQPPRPVGRKQEITPTPVELWAKDHGITTLSFPSDKQKPWLYENEQTVIDTLQPLKADLLISASYGQKIPTETITSPIHGGLNVHPSLLPRWRGADPVPWAILSGDHQAGATIVSLSEKFDDGKIIAQKKHPITDNDFSDSLRTTLFTLGSKLLTDSLPDYLDGKIKGARQHGPEENIKQFPYARRLTRDDGFIPWEVLQKAMAGQDVPKDKRPATLSLDLSHISLTIAKAFRALSGWPGLWTLFKEKRLKLLELHVEPVINVLKLDTVQMEGKNPVSYEQFAQAYLKSSATS